MSAARQRQRRAALSSMGEEKSNLRTLEQTLEQARRDAAARRTALEQTHFGVQTPDEAGETAERDAQRAEALADTAAHGGKPYFWIAALVLSALCAVLGYLVAQPLYYAAIALAVLAVVLLVAANNGKSARSRPRRARGTPAQLRRAGHGRHLLSGGGAPGWPTARARPPCRRSRKPPRARGCARAPVRDARAAAAESGL